MAAHHESRSAWGFCLLKDSFFFSPPSPSACLRVTLSLFCKLIYYRVWCQNAPVVLNWCYMNTINLNLHLLAPVTWQIKLYNEYRTGAVDTQTETIQLLQVVRNRLYERSSVILGIIDVSLYEIQAIESVKMPHNEPLNSLSTNQRTIDNTARRLSTISLNPGLWPCICEADREVLSLGNLSFFKHLLMRENTALDFSVSSHPVWFVFLSSRPPPPCVSHSGTTQKSQISKVMSCNKTNWEREWGRCQSGTVCTCPHSPEERSHQHAWVKTPVWVFRRHGVFSVQVQVVCREYMQMNVTKLVYAALVYGATDVVCWLQLKTSV